uniref:Thioesterase family protein n=1 Tax=Neobodo designis TaxID=312471 RepID=A0A7S1R0D2_NEODS|mmetsp:Transcript_6000/g.18944  ORF Transcript_6000/g.18944 Transcript_6000/m.18944 type:complete len:331 (+) Transcript_6000:487-1479(+)
MAHTAPRTAAPRATPPPTAKEVAGDIGELVLGIEEDRREPAAAAGAGSEGERVHRFHTAIDGSFSQGRTLFGGIGAALAFEAVHRALRAERADAASVLSLRSILVCFAGPIFPGAIDARAKVLRAGKNIVTAEGKLEQQGGTRLALIANMGNAIRSSVAVAPKAAKASKMPSRESVPDTPMPSPEFPTTSTFLAHLHVKWHTGIPMKRDVPNARRTAMWIRHRNLDFYRTSPTAALLAIADVPPPIIMLHFDTVPNASSVTWFLEFVIDPRDVVATNPDGWFFLDYRLDSAKDGYSQQSGRIYAEDGRLVAYSRQSMVYYDPKPAAKGKL